jgi:hypothetical protein
VWRSGTERAISGASFVIGHRIGVCFIVRERCAGCIRRTFGFCIRVAADRARIYR